LLRSSRGIPPYSVFVHKVTGLPPNGAAMQPIDVMKEIICGEDFVYWLDTARASAEGGDVSIMGASRRRVEYWGQDKPINQQGIKVLDENGIVYENPDKDILRYLEEQHSRAVDQVTMMSLDDSMVPSLRTYSDDSRVNDMIPFHFRGGHVGYLGYEVRFDTSRYLSNGVKRLASAGEDHDRSNPNIPTAAFLWADRSLVFHHDTSDWFLVAVQPKGDDGLNEATLEWMRSMTRRLQAGRALSHKGQERIRLSGANLPIDAPSFVPNRSRQTYNRNFDECIHHILNGESYEMCLTNQLEAMVKREDAAPVDLYAILRRRNPAPFSAFLNWQSDRRRGLDAASKAAFSICCSSPERFVSIKRKPIGSEESTLSGFEVEAKPIKGTIARVLPSKGKTSLSDSERAEDQARTHQLRSSVKDRAENLMIVDLLRNDLNRVCETGSVRVANLTAIESFATVHQMVSTIRGRLKPNHATGAVDIIKACFPGGSMTGAPKRRTMELLNEMEESASRGPYSGSLGYISLNGCMDMNIVIRTAVVTPAASDDGEDAYWKVSIGAGGAITALSKSSDEYDEMMLKAFAVMGAVQEWAAISELHPHSMQQVNETSRPPLRA
jgi:para-aminobenzoate synthetase